VSSVAVAFHPHHVEHLAPLCALMRMPMLVCDGPGQRAAAECYPGLQVAGVHDVTTQSGLACMIADVRGRRPQAVFYSHLFDRTTLRELFGAGRDSPRVVHCPHGFSEKRQGYARGIAEQDVALLYGPHALDQLKELGVTSPSCRLVLTGNLRHAYYLAHRAFFRRQLKALGMRAGRPRRTILYAPTWNDAVGSSSFVSALAPLAQQLPDDCRLVVKMHPHQEYEADEMHRLLASCHGRGNVHVIRNSPLTFPLLDMADIYVGDMSSLAYDFLIFDRPMFFLNQTAGTVADARDSRLFRCGTRVDPGQYADIYPIIEGALAGDAVFSAARAELYRYTHADGASAGGLRARIAAACEGVAPAWMQSAASP
jgi:hypothetical protein